MNATERLDNAVAVLWRLFKLELLLVLDLLLVLFVLVGVIVAAASGFAIVDLVVGWLL